MYLRPKSFSSLLSLCCFCAILGTQQAAFSQSNDCRTIYEKMRANAQSNPGQATQMGKIFLQNGCGTTYPDLVAPVRQYVSVYENQHNTAARPAGTAPNPAARGQGPQYKVGDHVEFSENSACLGAQFAIPSKGTILAVNTGTAMNYVIRVDPAPGRSARTMTRPISAQECGFRTLAGVAPQQLDVCPTDEPAGPVSRASSPSAQTFKRVIYEQEKEIETQHRDVQKVGMTFELFELGPPFTNRLTGGGLRQDGSQHLLMHDGAPENATIYPLRARFSKCVQRPTWKRLWVIEENFDCFKNKAGDWACPVGVGETKFLKQVDLDN